MNRRTVSAGALLLGAAIVLDASTSAAQGWQPVAPMPTARGYHAASTAGDRWYVAGGVSIDGGREQFPTEVDVYDPVSGAWTTIGDLFPGREYVRAVADPVVGRVLFVGGLSGSGPNDSFFRAASDLATRDGVSLTPGLLVARYLHAVAFAAGKFVVSGGWATDLGNLLGDAEVWDGTSSSWRPAGTMPAGPRAGHTMTTLGNGRDVLVVGGGPSDRALAQTDLFDASCGRWSPGPSLKVARARHQAVLLKDGRVLVAGGMTYPSPTMLQRSAEVFDPTAGEWKLVASMSDARFDFEMVLLPDGRVLAAGGSEDSVNGEFGALRSAEVYDPIADTWTPLPPMNDRRRWPTMAVLSDGVYIAGGSFASDTGPGSASVLASVERLAWSDLGITDPVEQDAGVPEGAGPAPSPSCGSEDGGMAADAATEDAGMEHNDAASSDRQPDIGRNGCSCDLGAPGRDSLVELMFAALVLAPVLRTRPDARRH